MIGKEVEKALNDAISGTKINVSEFTWDCINKREMLKLLKVIF